MMMMNLIKIETSIASQGPVLARQQYLRMTPAFLHTSSIQQKGIIEKAKDLGHKANMKVGEKLAEGIEEAEHLIHEAPNPKGLGDKVKQAGHEVNMKVGQTLAHGIDKAENSAEDLKHKTETIRHKAELAKEETQEAAEKAKHRLENEAKDTDEEINRKLDENHLHRL